MSNYSRHRRRRPQRPTRQQIDSIVAASAAVLGCTCVEVDVRVGAGHLTVSIGHDEGCPAEHAGRVPVLYIPRGHQ